MKGCASTSLMKTLISKKPSTAAGSSKVDNKVKNSNLNNILESLNIEEPPGKIQSNPIGTTFALTMLGLTSMYSFIFIKIRKYSKCD